MLATGGQDKLAQWPLDGLRGGGERSALGRHSLGARPLLAQLVKGAPSRLPGCWDVRY